MTSTAADTAADTAGARLGRGARATIEDVARLAGVSVATVSRALRGLPNVAVSTRDRVVEVATELNYRADPAASRLAAGHTRTIIVGVPTLASWYFSSVVSGAEAVCTEAGYDFLVVTIGSLRDRDRLVDEDHHLERRTDGLILVDVALADEVAASLRRRGVHVGAVGTTVADTPSVRIDDEHVGRLAAEHLTALGHRRLGVIGGLPEDPLNFVVPDARRVGFELGLAAVGATLDPTAVVSGNFDIDGGREAMLDLLDADEPPTAVFAMSDEMAFGALIALRERGLEVGVDVSLVGVDDHEFSRVVGLTTVAQPVADHGADIARMVIARIRADAAAQHTPRRRLAADLGPTHVEPEIELVVRSSTGPPR